MLIKKECRDDHWRLLSSIKQPIGQFNLFVGTKKSNVETKKKALEHIDRKTTWLN